MLRNGTSDFAVFCQVFLERQYDLPIVPKAEYIVDAGANIGLASVYFLSRNPRARVVAIEPDPENFEIAQENLRSFGDRCKLIHGAVWSHSGTLAISRGSFRDGKHWATQTLPIVDDTHDSVRAYSVNELTRDALFPRIDLFKMDIEGAELQVFRDGETGFLMTTRCCAVECHGDDCVNAYSAAIQAAGFRLRQSSELLIAEPT
jgi:FkbM family methyltransferase